MKLRILFSALLLTSVLFAPLWVSFLLLVFGMFYFYMYFEGIALFLLSDLLFGVENRGYFGIIFSSTIISVIVLVTTELLKKKLKFYPIIKN